MSSRIEIEFINFFLEKKTNARKNPANSTSMMKNINPARKNISENKGLTPGVSNFYKKISSYGQLKLNWARGLASYGIIF